MGSPFGPTLVNIFMCYHSFMCYHESIALINALIISNPSFKKRYVDDTFTYFLDPHHGKQFFDYLNSQHENIKITKSCELPLTPPFLFWIAKFLFLRTLFTLVTIYRKPTLTGLGKYFHSFIFSRFKIKGIKTNT